MTEELQTTLAREMEDAEKIKDIDRRRDAMMTVMSHFMLALCDCQRKTSERVKTLVKEAEDKAARIKGFKYAIEIGKMIVSLGGGALLMKYLGGAA